MASVLNRTTRQFITSANTPEYPVGQWIIEPNLSAVTGFGSQYWIITGDVVTLMTQGQRDAVDATVLGTRRDDAVAKIDQVEEILRAVVLIILDEINELRSQVIHPITSITRSGTVGTVVTPVAHGLATNDQVTIGGADVTTYRGLFTVTVTNSTTFTVPGLTGSPVSPAAGTLYYFQGIPSATAPRTIAQLRTAIRNRLGS